MKATFFHGRPLMIDYTPVADVAAGDVIVVNSRLYIAHTDIPANPPVPYGLSAGNAVYTIVKDTSTFAAGDPWFWDAGAQKATSTSGGNTFGGYCETGAATGAATVNAILILTPLTITVRGSVANPIADPGNAGAIPVTASGYVPIVTAGSETRTLAIPSFIGQVLLLYVKTDGGTAVITVASAINQTGNNTITMADVRDVIQLVAIESGSNKVWHVVSNDGAALSTV